MMNKLKPRSSSGPISMSPLVRMLCWSILLTAVQVARAQEWCICECSENENHHGRAKTITLLQTVTVRETRTITYHRTVSPHETVVIDPQETVGADPAVTSGLGPHESVIEDPSGSVIVLVPDPSGTSAVDPQETYDPRESYAPQGTTDPVVIRVSTVPLTATVPIVTSVVSSQTVQILPSLTASISGTSGTLVTSLETSGRPSSVPLLTDAISSPTSLLSAATSLRSSLSSSASASVSASVLFVNQSSTAVGTAVGTGASTGSAVEATSAMAPTTLVDDIFVAIATDAPPAVISQRSDHPVPRQGIITSGGTTLARRAAGDASSYPIETNKFYANAFLSQQTSPSYLHPYVLNWVRNVGPVVSWGMGVSHVDASQRVYGSTNTIGAASYFINPINIHSFIISAAGLQGNTVLTTQNITAGSVLVSLAPGDGLTPYVQFPFVQGAGFVTAIFKGAVPYIQSGVFFRTVTRAARSPKAGVTKYSFLLEDGHTWYLYAHNTSGTALNLQVVNNSLAAATDPFYGTIQIAKEPGSAEGLYDEACGAYATGVQLSGSAQGTVGTYKFNFEKAGMSDAPLLMYALPHHIESFDTATLASVNTSVQLQTTTKGVSTAVLADSWTMIEPEMPVNMSFAPWTPSAGALTNMSASVKATIRAAAAVEVSQNMSTQSDQASMYYGGKALNKFAWIIYVINDILGDTALAQAGLDQLKQAFTRFTSNTQQYPLVYESAWGGVVSSSTYTTGDSGMDFGNTYYNDHHFHYGYFVLAAAVIGYLDPSWMEDNRAYVNTLLRDYANPSESDPWFPVWRSFDWYHGHSWAHGLYDTMDGKDQESSSEDVMSAYAMKMWGTVSGDAAMAARGNLLLAVMARSMGKYYLYRSDNDVEPSEFIPNKVAGILFENKIDHTTYFGTNVEYIQGIHMLPLLPSSPLVRSAAFVEEEWATWFSDGRADVDGGWRGILYGNLATAEPGTAWDFFTSSSFDSSYLDGGASLTWYLAFAGALANA